MKKKVVNTRKARTRCPAIYYRFMYNAPVKLRRERGIFGPDKHDYDAKHGIV